MIKSDYKAYHLTLKRLIIGLFTGHCFYTVMLYRQGNFLVRNRIKFLPDVLKYISLRAFACEISPYAQIGSEFKIYHSPGIVIGWNVKIGDRCTVFQNVTIGEIAGKTRDGQTMPVIGNNVTIYSGAVVAGPIRIGDNVVIGANSVVTKDIPSNCFVAGVPANIIRYFEEKR